MTQHTKGSHLPTAYETVSGASVWWNEPCYCDRVQPISTPQQFTFTTTGSNMTAAQNTVNIPLTGTWQTWYPDTIYVPSPNVHIHYCHHEEVNKHLLELIKILIEKISQSRPNAVETGPRDRPVNQTKEET